MSGILSRVERRGICEDATRVCRISAPSRQTAILRTPFSVLHSAYQLMMALPDRTDHPTYPADGILWALARLWVQQRRNTWTSAPISFF